MYMIYFSFGKLLQDLVKLIQYPLTRTGMNYASVMVLGDSTSALRVPHPCRGGDFLLSFLALASISLVGAVRVVDNLKQQQQQQ
ncbi:hypothetical protein RRG08_016515 [Elysia crispata]|uniref:Uncharacterized protein n=1 Tax=Elysia crispata TaxID=231223 RepID=A0AAE1CV36_9GAST|nr:hypothetical protein RRG08_016515 [Elysia crispata]